MNIYLWITVLIFIIYFALIYTASVTGWFERNNMSLALGFIVMWRTQQGKELIVKAAFMVVAADGDLHQKEKELLARLAQALGMTSAHLTGIVNQFAQTH